MLLLLVSLFSLLSCVNESRVYVKLRVEITDTVSEYRIYFYTRILDGFKGESLPMILTITSPDGRRFRDTISFPLAEEGNYGNVEEVRSGIWRDLRWLYRDGVVFPKSGLWVFSVKQASSDNLQKIRDMGVTIKEK
ncbi:MAG: hypothetical protein ABFC28_01165 [Rikenellaceae bacterium]